jgi:hypothetical protein
MHDITGGHEKLQLLYLLFEKAFSRPSGYLFKRSLLAWEAATLLARISCFSAISHLSLIPLFFSFFLAMHDAGFSQLRGALGSHFLARTAFWDAFVCGLACPLYPGKASGSFLEELLYFSSRLSHLYKAVL